jgi:hypothetical protein
MDSIKNSDEEYNCACSFNSNCSKLFFSAGSLILLLITVPFIISSFDCIDEWNFPFCIIFIILACIFILFSLICISIVYCQHKSLCKLSDQGECRICSFCKKINTTNIGYCFNCRNGFPICKNCRFNIAITGNRFYCDDCIIP